MATTESTRETGIRLIADVPGVKRDDLDISITGNRLIVSGQREAERRGKDETLQAYEREFGQFTRLFSLPEQPIPQRTVANAENHSGEM